MLSIDITDSRINVVCGTPGKKVRVTYAVSKNIPEGWIINGYIQENSELVSTLREFLVSHKIKEKDVIATISSAAILNKDVIIKKPKDIKNTIAMESILTANIGLSDEYNIAYMVYPHDADEEGTEQIKVVTSSCPQMLIEGYTKLFSSAGLNLKKLCMSNMCVSRLVLKTDHLYERMPFMLVQVNEAFLNLTLYENGGIGFTRHVKIDKEEYSDSENYLYQAIYDNLFFVNQFMQSRPNFKPLKEIMIFGAANDFLQLSNAISSFGVPIKLFGAPPTVSVECELDFYQFAGSIGSLIEMDDTQEKLNVIQSTAAKKKIGMNSFLRTAAFSVILSCLVAACAWLGVYLLGDSARAEVSGLKTQLEDPVLAQQIDEANIKMASLENYKNYFGNVFTAKAIFDYVPKPTTTVLQKLESPLTEGMEIVDNVGISGYQVNVKYTCTNQDQPAAYVRALNKQDFFENIEYKGFAKKENQEGENERASASDEESYSFELSMTIRNTPVPEGAVPWGNIMVEKYLYDLYKEKLEEAGITADMFNSIIRNSTEETAAAE